MTDEELKYFTRKYSMKKASTKGRKDKTGKEIQFLLSFDEYVQLYKQQNKLPTRVNVLSRFDDVGDYVMGNVYVQHVLHNLSQAAGKTSEQDIKITQYCIDNDYPRRMVKDMIKRGDIEL